MTKQRKFSAKVKNMQTRFDGTDSITRTLRVAAVAINSTYKNYTAAIVLAAGNSTRMGKGINKQMEKLFDVPVLAHTLMAYQKCPLIREIVVVTRPQSFDEIYQLAQEYGITKLLHIVAGGNTRQESAVCGMRKLGDHVKYVAIADGARCLTTPGQIAKVCLRAYRCHAASAAHKISDTVKRTTASGLSNETVDRTNLWQAQTPQVFHTALYTAAIYNAQKDGFECTDDNSLIEHLGYHIRMVECGQQNIKITTPQDLPLAKAILQYRGKGQ